jgi:hypothetical protein
MNSFSYILYRFRLWRNDRDTYKFNEYNWHLECQEYDPSIIDVNDQ